MNKIDWTKCIGISIDGANPLIGGMTDLKVALLYLPSTNIGNQKDSIRTKINIGRLCQNHKYYQEWSAELSQVFSYITIQINRK